MNAFVDLNESGDLARRLGDLRKKFETYSPEPLASLAKKFKTGDRADRNGHSNRGSHARSSLKVAATEFVAGASAEKFREILRGAVRDFAATVPLFDYAPFQQTVAMTKAQAKKYSSGTMAHDL